MKKETVIGIDIRPFLHDQAGIGQYIYQLTKALLKGDSGHKYVLFADAPFSLDLPKRYSTVIYTSRIPKLTSTLYHIKTILFAKRHCDIYISASSLFVPFVRKDFAVLVVHDLAMIAFPKYAPLKTRIFTKLFLHRALRNAKEIIAVSTYTRDDLEKYAPNIPKEKIHVIVEGVNMDLVSKTEPYNKNVFDGIKKKFNISKQYILFIGTIQPRKNVLSLIKVFEKLLKEKKYDMQLVLVGRKGWKNEAFDSYMASRPKGIQNSIITTGFASEQEKAYLLKNAYMLVYPSYYEGFGIPVLEAMSFGIPVVSSNTSSLPEVVGDSGILIDPYSSKDLYNGIKKLLDDKTFYNILKERSQKRIILFNWDSIAKEVIKILK